MEYLSSSSSTVIQPSPPFLAVFGFKHLFCFNMGKRGRREPVVAKETDFTEVKILLSQFNNKWTKMDWEKNFKATPVHVLKKLRDDVQGGTWERKANKILENINTYKNTKEGGVG